ncbi:hypothetical protein P3S67_009706 [Capsicum chacoense]
MKQYSSSSARLLEIIVISYENLLDNRKQPIKKNAFVNIKTESTTCNEQRKKMDKESKSFSTWNEKLIVDMPMHARYLTMEVQCKTSWGIETIGIAKWKAAAVDMRSSYNCSYVIVTNMPVYPDQSISNLMANKF